MSHTPGPWQCLSRARRPARHSSEDLLRDVHDSTGELLATCYYTMGDDGNRVIANALLIAAAPDLLEAATQTLGLCRIRGECADVQPDEYCCGEHVALASAIEKAEGKL